MSKSDAWMPLHIGDYLSDTMRLTTIQHGAYLLLLMQYWKSGPFVNDDDELAGIAKMDIRTWSKVGPVVRRFFTVGEDGLLHQKRADQEREKAASISQKRRDAVSQRADRRPSNPPQGGSDDGSDGGCGGQQDSTNGSTNVASLNAHLNTHARTELQPHKPKKEKEDRSLRSLPQTKPSSDFDVWWERYPRKVGKDAAWRAYASALRRGGNPEDMLHALTQQRWNSDAQFIPHPATWLNGGRWNDDPEAAAPAPAPPENPALRRIRQQHEALHRMTYPEQYADGAPVIDQEPEPLRRLM